MSGIDTVTRSETERTGQGYSRSDETPADKSRGGESSVRRGASELRSPTMRSRAMPPLSESELFRGYGACGRCGGTGAIDLEPHRAVTCPRCGGTGVKGAT